MALRWCKTERGRECTCLWNQNPKKGEQSETKGALRGKWLYPFRPSPESDLLRSPERRLPFSASISERGLLQSLMPALIKSGLSESRYIDSIHVCRHLWSPYIWDSVGPPRAIILPGTLPSPNFCQPQIEVFPSKWFFSLGLKTEAPDHLYIHSDTK